MNVSLQVDKMRAVFVYLLFYFFGLLLFWGCFGGFYGRQIHLLSPARNDTAFGTVLNDINV